MAVLGTAAAAVLPVCAAVSWNEQQDQSDPEANISARTLMKEPAASVSDASKADSAGNSSAQQPADPTSWSVQAREISERAPHENETVQNLLYDANGNPQPVPQEQAAGDPSAAQEIQDDSSQQSAAPNSAVSPADANGTQSTVQTIASEQPAGSQSGSYVPYEHEVTTGFITSEMTGSDSYAFLDALRQGNRNLYYTDDTQNAEDSLSEVVSFYCSMPEGINYYEMHDLNGNYLQIADSSWNTIEEQVAQADQGWKEYQAYIDTACHSLNLDVSDYELVNEINQFICDNYDYEVTNAGMPNFISTHKGQCWHYAKMFADMCNAVSIDAWKVENAEHAWNQVRIDDVIYTFDPTFNDTSGSPTAYSWQLS